jgi:hypothetical protein
MKKIRDTDDGARTSSVSSRSWELHATQRPLDHESCTLSTVLLILRAAEITPLIYDRKTYD